MKVSKYIMYKGSCWHVKHVIDYNNLPDVWNKKPYIPEYKGKVVMLLETIGLRPYDVDILSLEDYVQYVVSLKLPKGYRKVTYKDIEDGKHVCLRDGGDGEPSYTFDYNDIAENVSNGKSCYICISTSPENMKWVRLYDLCIKK